MTDELDDLRQAMERDLPAPDPARKADALAQAMRAFDAENAPAAQGTADEARHTSVPAREGLFRGVLEMLSRFNTRAVLTATTALAAIALVAVIPVLRQPPQDVGLPAGSGTETAPVEPPVTPVQQRPETMPQVTIERAGSETTDRLSDRLVVTEELAMESSPPAEDLPSPSPVMRSESRTLARPAPVAPDPAGGGTFSAMSGVNRAGAPAARSAPDLPPRVLPDTEAFPEVDDNPLKVTAEDPVSTFSIDVDTASWAVVRNSLNWGQLPPRDAVRVEEMVNYFDYAYAAPEGDVPFATHVGLSDSPWREGTQIVQIGLQGAVPTDRPPLNLVFLIDTSGSMNQPNKLPLLKQSFRLMLGQLSAEDSVAIVAYAGSAGRVLDPTPASDRASILAALDRLAAGGSTAGQAGLQMAYATAAEMAGDGEVSRVILATDGDFNVGISDPDELEDYIAVQRETGTYLSVLGFGRGNLDDATMQALAQTGNGMAAYIDTLAEAQKVLVDQVQGALVPIADDVKIQVEWNPAQVAEYRLIGYETRALRREDFNNDRVDAGEIGAGHQVTALYEITPVGSDARMTDPLRYGTSEVSSDSDELGFLRLRYKAPGEAESQLIETPILADTPPLAESDWAIAIAGFGQILRGSTLIGDWSMDDAIALAQEARGDDRFGYRQEAITLMRLAQSLQAAQPAGAVETLQPVTPDRQPLRPLPPQPAIPAPVPAE